MVQRGNIKSCFKLGRTTEENTNSLELLMVKLRLVHVSSNGIKNSDMNVRSFKVIQVVDVRQIFINTETIARPETVNCPKNEYNVNCILTGR